MKNIFENEWQHIEIDYMSLQIKKWLKNMLEKIEKY